MNATAPEKEYLEPPMLMPQEHIVPIDNIACLVVGPSLAMQNVLRLSERVASNGVTVLVTGESGTGKEVIARFIHKMSPREQKPFCAINCAAIPETLIESELFGYEAGAFTGANRPKMGRLELASDGTVFLDEIEAASPALQQKILRVIEHKEIERVGGTTTRRVDIRFIVASNRDLKKEVEEGRFREDLFYRFTVPINIPPLRNRVEDISNLAHFLLAKKVRAHDENAPTRISVKALNVLEKAYWKGNIRELENVLTQAVFNRYNIGEVLYSNDLTPFIVKFFDDGEKPTEIQPSAGLKELVNHSKEKIEQEIVRKILNETEWNKKLTAHKLGISYKALLNKVKKWGWEKPRISSK